MPDTPDTARLRDLLTKSKERGLSIPGDPAWPIEQERHANIQKALREQSVNALPALLDRIEALEAGLRKIRERKWNSLTQGCDTAAEAQSIARALLEGEKGNG